MKLKLQGAAAWLPLLVVVLAVSACGGGGGGNPAPAASPPPAAAPPPASAPPPSGGGDAAGPPAPPPPAAVPAPSALSYTTASSYTVGTALTPLEPSVTGTVTGYLVSPGFPAGITLDATTGRISGTPTAPAPSRAYTVTASNASGSTTFEMSFSVLNARVSEDRPDEKTGHQVHVVYAIPSDGVDEQLDQTGTIEASVRVMNEWFARQTGGRELRLDTYDNGKLDVTFLRLTRTDAQMNVFRSSVRKELEQQLYLMGFDSVDKMYLVYYGGDGENCGRGAWPPSLPGNVAALYIGQESGCRNVPFASGNEPPAFLEFLALHEALHVLGFVPTCAPNYTRTGHVRDSVRDVMYSSDPTGTVLGEPSTLDVNLDDYFGRSVPGCLDLSNSAFLDPLPAGAESPPGWPYVDLADLGCSTMPTPTPGTLGVDTGIMFVNRYLHNGTESTAQIFEVVPDPDAPGTFRREHRRNVAYNDGIMLPDNIVPRVQENAVYVVLVNGRCHRIVRTTANPSRFIIE